MTLEARIVAVVQAIGADVKLLTGNIGNLASLDTTVKTNIVSAINELKGLVDGLSAGAAGIDDLAGNGDTTVTWSADKIYDTIELAKAAVKNEILDGAGPALDTLKELQDALGGDANFATTISTALGLRVRVDAAQTFDSTQMAQARTNIDAASQTDLDALETAIGDPDHDFVADYTTAKT